MAYSKRSRRRISRRRVNFKNHRHIVKPMSGVTSIPVKFRGRRISYAK